MEESQVVHASGHGYGTTQETNSTLTLAAGDTVTVGAFQEQGSTGIVLSCSITVRYLSA